MSSEFHRKPRNATGRWQGRGCTPSLPEDKRTHCGLRKFHDLPHVKTTPAIRLREWGPPSRVCPSCVLRDSRVAVLGGIRPQVRVKNRDDEQSRDRGEHQSADDGAAERSVLLGAFP